MAGVPLRAQNRAGQWLRTVQDELKLNVEEFGLQGSLAQANTGHRILRLAALIARERVELVHANDSTPTCWRCRRRGWRA
jgi:hypothetical protein